MTHEPTAPPRTLRVLESFGRLGAQTNPYITMLAEAISSDPDLELHYFSLREALLGRYDVVHLHWPEVLVERRGRVKTLVRQALVLLVVARWAMLRTPVVRTVHNLDLPSGLSRRERFALWWMDRLVVLRIRLNDHTPVSDGTAAVTIPHGHYSDWFASYPRSEPMPGRLGFVGLVRRYKGVETLVETFRHLDDERASLRIAGKPSSDAIREHLATLAQGDPRISMRLEYLDDRAFVAEMTTAHVVVLPYLHMHNSGATLAALSLGRPALVPDTVVNRELSEEVGPGWVRFIPTDGLSIQALRDALDEPIPPVPPDLSKRGWEQAGRAHADAFRRAVSGRR